jgi:hypothetical protein
MGYVGQREEQTGYEQRHHADKHMRVLVKGCGRSPDCGRLTANTALETYDDRRPQTRLLNPYSRVIRVRDCGESGERTRFDASPSDGGLSDGGL